jgi:hypothetical protein
MALTPLQRRVCRLLAEERKRSGESYVAGGGALNELLGGSRMSHDVDLFHDTEAALVATWPKDRETLVAAGLTVEPLREQPAFVEVRVRDLDETVLVQWVQDSAYRFFPLVEHETLGLTLHPFDLATNKVLALAGRREARDWIDAIQCHEHLQPLGYLAWAAAGKDPGLGPLAIIEEAARTRYSAVEIAALEFGGPAPGAAELSVRWHQAVADAREIVRALPGAQVGRCVIHGDGQLEKASPLDLPRELEAGRVSFHEGRIRGAYPEVRLNRGGGVEK